MRKTIIGTFSVVLGTFLLLDSLPGITGYVVSSQETLNLLSLFGFVFLACGIGLFILEAREKSRIKSEKRKSN